MPRFPHRSFEATAMDAALLAVVAVYCLVIGTLMIDHDASLSVAMLLTAYVGFTFAGWAWQLARPRDAKRLFQRLRFIRLRFIRPAKRRETSPGSA